MKLDFVINIVLFVLFGIVETTVEFYIFVVVADCALRSHATSLKL